MVLYRSLDDISLSDTATVGGKAARLGTARRLGCPVLPGMVLSTELYQRFMRQGGLQGEIASILNSMQPTAIAHFQAVEWAIHSAFQVRRMPSDVAQAIVEAWHELGDVPVAVRSSATNEDSPQQSFVGQHATCLNVDTEQALIKAVLDCWMSLFSAKALSYAHHFGVDLLSSCMAIILQPMISGSEMGALFTANPINGDPDLFILEIQQGQRPGVHTLDPYERAPGEPYHWSQLRHYGLMLDEHEDAFQAIEWAIADEQLYLLRVRPVTIVPPYLPTANIQIDNRAEPLRLVRPPQNTSAAPQPFSWYHRSRSAQLNAARFRYADKLFSPYASREEYYVKGYLYARTERFLTLAYTPVLSKARRLVISARMLHAARTLDGEYRALDRDQRPLLDQLKQVDPSSLSSSQLGAHLAQILDSEVAFWAQRFRLEHASQALSYMFTRLYRQWIGDDLKACSDLLWTEEDHLSQAKAMFCEQARAMYADKDRERQALASARAQFRHLYLADDPFAEWQDISRLHIDDQALDTDWKLYHSDGKPDRYEEITKRQAKRALLEEQTLAQLNALQRWLYTSVLGMTQRYAPLARDCEEAVRLCFALERDVIDEIGRRLTMEGLTSRMDDAALLGITEIAGWLNNSLPRDQIVRHIIQRKALVRKWRRYVPPDELVTHRNEPPPVEASSDQGQQWHGRSISPGQAHGRARLINSLTEVATILPGEILVCREPLFELTPLFKIVAAVVSEAGGLLDHAGVLAREYSIPAVFGIREATKLIHNGDDLLVDGAHGIVSRHTPQIAWDEF